MVIEDILSIITPIVFIVVGAGLVWLVIELALTVRKARGTVDDVKKQLDPTLESVQKITASIEPIVTKVDPLMDRVSLTVDAANLEIMRVDQILEDVSQITATTTKTMDAVGSITNAPLDLVNSVTDKVRSKFKKRDASNVSVQLGTAEGAEGSNQGTVKNFVDTSVDIASAAVTEQKDKMAQHKAERAEKAAAQQEATDKMNATAATLSDAMFEKADEDAASGTPVPGTAK